MQSTFVIKATNPYLTLVWIFVEYNWNRTGSGPGFYTPPKDGVDNTFHPSNTNTEQSVGIEPATMETGIKYHEKQTVLLALI